MIAKDLPAGAEGDAPVLELVRSLTLGKAFLVDFLSPAFEALARVVRRGASFTTIISLDLPTLDPGIHFNQVGGG